MDDKVFNLLEKMYGDFMDKFDKVNDELKSLKDGQTKISMAIENDIKPNIKLSLQGYHDTNEKLTSIESKIDKLEAKIERHDVEINVIKRVK
jgi:hypothetical protein